MNKETSQLETRSTNETTAEKQSTTSNNDLEISEVIDKIEDIKNIIDFENCSVKPNLDADSLEIQKTVFNCLKVIFEKYISDDISVEFHCKWNSIIVPLLKVVFERPNMAWLAYKIHNNKNNAPSPIVMLYEEIESILRLRQKSIQDREDLLVILKGNQGKDGLEQTVKNKLNEIIHAEPPDNRNKNNQKLSRLAQLSCLIRYRDQNTEATQSSSRRYGSHLDGILYKKINIIDAENIYKFEWKPQQNLEKFQEALKSAYKFGHNVEFLQNLFTASDRGCIWVQDGEISFFWMLEAQKAIREKNKQGENAIEQSYSISSKNIYEEKITTLDFSSLENFLTEHCMLFKEDNDGKKKPTHKFWAFVNFLHRLCINNYPSFFDDSVKTAAEKLLNSLKLEQASSTNLNNLLLTWLNSFNKPEDLTEIINAARFKTYLLEAILRDGDPSPYTLFFLPLNFDSFGGKVLPSTFLAGTFGGLEWDAYPSVTSRQNLHLYSIIDAIRPAIDEEIGRVMEADRDAYIDKLNTYRLFQTIQPHLKEVSDLIGKTQNKINLIDSNIDTDWAGLLRDKVNSIFEELFNVNSRLEYYDGNNKRLFFIGAHNPRDWDINKAKEAFEYLSYSLGRGINDNDFKDYPILDKFYTQINKPHNEKNIVQLIKLLKIFFVDASQADRGIYKAQIYVAIGRTKRLDWQDYDLLSNNDALISLLNINPFKRYNLRPGCKPSVFLKNLKNLVDALPQLSDDDRAVGVSSIEINDKINDNTDIKIILKCYGAFQHDFQRILFEYMSSQEQVFHDLRAAFTGISKTVGHPVFGKDKEATKDEPFVISTKDNGSSTNIEIYLQGHSSNTTKHPSPTKIVSPKFTLYYIRFLEIHVDDGGQSESPRRIQKWEQKGIKKWDSNVVQPAPLIFAHANDLFSSRFLGDIRDWKKIRDFLKKPKLLILYSGGKVYDQGITDIREMIDIMPEWVKIQDSINDSNIDEMLETYGLQKTKSFEDLINEIKVLISANNPDYNNHIDRLCNEINAQIEFPKQADYHLFEQFIVYLKDKKDKTDILQKFKLND